jgi:COMPASS component SWD2
MVDDEDRMEEDEPLEDEDPPVPFPIKNYTSASLAALFPPPFNPDIEPPVVESLEFHREGRYLLSLDSSSDLMQIDVVTGKAIKKFSCTRYPVGLCRYTHHSQAVLCSSRSKGKSSSKDDSEGGTNHDIRYLSLHDNTFQRFFPGHTDEVVSMAMNPSNDTFASASKDKTVRLWNLKSSICSAVLTTPSEASAPHVAYDPTG